MNIIKSKLLSWGIDQSHLHHGEEGRVIVHDPIQVKGSLHRLLPAQQYSSPIPSALVSIPVNEITTFTLAIGSIRIPILASMLLNPSITSLQDVLREEADFSMSLFARDGKCIYIQLPNAQLLQKWHRAFREAMVEMLFTQAFQVTKEGYLSIKKLENAIKKSQVLVPAANCHVLRAKRLRNLKVDINELIARIKNNEYSVTKEELLAFFQRAEVDRVSLFSPSFFLSPAVFSLTFCVLLCIVNP